MTDTKTKRTLLTAFCFSLIITFCFGQNKHKREKLALILANSDYAYAALLDNPIAPAINLEKALNKKGIDVLSGYNGNRMQMLASIEKFAEKLRLYKTGMIFYLGHGFQIDGKNYLIPVEANPKNKTEVSTQAIELTNLLSIINDPEKPKIIVLDACRNNPFTPNWLTKEKASLQKGFTLSQVMANSQVIFTTRQDTEVSDENPYIDYFIEELQGNVCLDKLLRKVANRIRNYDPEQIPVTYGQLLEEVCFKKVK